jgi:integrase
VRTSEAIALEVRDLHLETGEAWVPMSKTRKQRMVHLPQRALQILLEEPLPNGGRLLRRADGQPYVTRINAGGYFQKSFAAAREGADLGPEVTPHVLRHTWATWYYAQTRDYGGLMDLGGWDNAQTANRYRKAAPSDLGRKLLEHGWDFRRSFDL